METAYLLAVLICDVGGPGTPEQAQPVLDKFLRHLEKSGGWRAGSLGGAYRNSEAACQAYIDEHQPALVGIDLPTYLRQRKSWHLQPLAHMGKADAKRYYLLTRKGTFKTLAELKGKTLITSLARSKRFLQRVVFDNKVSPDYFHLETVSRPLKGLRRVGRGRAAATLVDETAYAYLDQLDLPSELVAVYRSSPMPGLTLTTTNSGDKNKQLTRRIASALPKLCRGDGAELCKTFGVGEFVRAKANVYRQLERRYEQ